MEKTINFIKNNIMNFYLKIDFFSEQVEFLLNIEKICFLLKIWFLLKIESLVDFFLLKNLIFGEI